VIPEGDAGAAAAAMRQVLGGGETVRARSARGVEVARRRGWSTTLAPLVAFLRRPRRDDTKREFVAALAATSPRDPLAFRVRRRLGRLLLAARRRPAGAGA
jgi:thioredoxin-like negative regulator of GroEL